MISSTREEFRVEMLCLTMLKRVVFVSSASLHGVQVKNVNKLWKMQYLNVNMCWRVTLTALL